MKIMSTSRDMRECRPGDDAARPPRALHIFAGSRPSHAHDPPVAVVAVVFRRRLLLLLLPRRRRIGRSSSPSVLPRRPPRRVQPDPAQHDRQADEFARAPAHLPPRALPPSAQQRGARTEDEDGLQPLQHARARGPPRHVLQRDEERRRVQEVRQRYGGQYAQRPGGGRSDLRHGEQYQGMDVGEGVYQLPYE